MTIKYDQMREDVEAASRMMSGRVRVSIFVMWLIVSASSISSIKAAAVLPGRSAFSMTAAAFPFVMVSALVSHWYGCSLGSTPVS